MIKDSYSTTPCKYVKTDVILKELKKASSDLDINVFRIPEYSGKAIVALTGPDHSIPPFSHPIYAKGAEWGYWDDTVFFDVRGFVKVNRDGTVNITQQHEYDILVLRALLTRYSHKRNIEDLLSIGTLPCQVFVTWLSELLSTRLSLDPEAQMRSTAIIAFYYFTMFRDTSDLSDTDLSRLVQTIVRLFKLNAEMVLELGKTLKLSPTIGSLVDALKEHGNTVRFEMLTTPFLVTIVGGSWFGHNHRELMAVCLEDPIAFIGVLSGAITNRAYKTTQINRVVERFTKRSEGEDYLTGLYRLPGLQDF